MGQNILKGGNAMVAKFQAWWQRINQYRVTIGVVAIILVVVIALIIIGYWFDWTGFNRSIGPQLKPNQQYQPEKTLWDWMSLLIIPGVLALVGFFFTRTERRNEQAIAKQRAETEQDLSIDNQQEAALQGYLDRMSALLLEKNLRESKPGDEVRTVARVRTLAMLYQLNTRRINYMLAFLRESKLVTDNTSTSIITFSAADLSNANLQGVDFHDIDLSAANLGKADLSETDLIGANLSEAYLRNANLREANLSAANLNGANLYETNLRNANLNSANLSKADLSRADLYGAFLYGAILSGADLSEANLSEANLNSAYLSKAKLSEANLFGANLRDAKVTKEQLDAAMSLKGATMPDGSKHP